MVDALASLADGITVKQTGSIPFDIIRREVDRIVLVTEDRIAEAVIMLLERKKVLAEGAGAVSTAALLAGLIDAPAGAKVVLVVSGGNIDISLFDRVIRKGLSWNGRIMRFSVRLDDEPGALLKLLTIVAAAKANVLQIYHNRGGPDVPVRQTRVELEIETRNFAHIRQIEAALGDAGYNLDGGGCAAGECGGCAAGECATPLPRGPEFTRGEVKIPPAPPLEKGGIGSPLEKGGS